MELNRSCRAWFWVLRPKGGGCLARGGAARVVHNVSFYKVKIATLEVKGVDLRRFDAFIVWSF